MNNLFNKIQEKLAAKNIKPRPKWEFRLLAVLTWSALVVLVLILGISLGLFFELLVKHDLPGYRQTIAVLQAIPYFWILIIGLVAIILVIKFKKTDKGYKIQLGYILSGILVLTVCIGLLTYYSGLAGSFELALENNAPGYEHIVRLPQNVWFDPESGNLYGEVVEVNSVEQFILIDREDGLWRVYLDPQTMLAPRLVIFPGLEVKIRGEALDEHEFKAFEIRPGFNNRPMGMQPICISGGNGCRLK